MGRKKQVVPTAEPALADEEGSGGGLDLEEEDSGRGLLIAVNKHVVNEDEDEEEEGEEGEDEEEDSEAPKQREGFVVLMPTALVLVVLATGVVCVHIALDTFP